MERFNKSGEMYIQRGFGKRFGFGHYSPALIIVDYIKAFTNSSYKLGGNFDSEINRLQKSDCKMQRKEYANYLYNNHVSLFIKGWWHLC